MKRILCLLLLSPFIFHFASAQNINDLETYEKALKPGTELVYDVTMGEKRYQLIATLYELDNEIAFTWKTTEPANKQGDIAMSAKAVSDADALFTDFSGGEKNLDKEVALFLSRKIFNDISSSAQAEVKLLGAADTNSLVENTISEFNFNLSDNLVAVPAWELEGGSDIKFKVTVIESYKYPLIVGVNFGWTMQLAEIRNP